MEPGVVYISSEELERMASYLAVTAAAFRRRYKVQREGPKGALYIDAEDGRGCPLLSADRRCMVHPVKPGQCAAFPFWSDLLEDDAAWEAAKAFCPGLDAPAGRLYSRGEIAAIREGWITT